MYVSDGNLTVNSSYFGGNSAYNKGTNGYQVDKGGAIYFSGSGNLTIDSTMPEDQNPVYIVTTTIYNNSATRGGGVYLEAGSGRVNISNVLVWGNRGVYNGSEAQ